MVLTEEELKAVAFSLEESRWTSSHIRGIYLRVDPARPEMKQRRHVHLSTKKHLRSPSQQASWNDNGTRHDRHNFNDKFGSRPDVKDVARVALGLPANTILEKLTTRAGRILESLNSDKASESVKLTTEAAK